MKVWGRRLVFSIQYWMRFLFDIDLHINPSDFGTSMRFFPLAGFFVGALTAGAMWMGYLTSSNLVAAGFAVCGQVLFSGAASVNGLANTLDATAYLDPMDKLGRMKKSTVEGRGITGIVLDLLLCFSFILTLLRFVEWPIVLVYLAATYVTPKLVWVFCACIFDSAENDGIGYMFITGANFKDFIWALVISFAILLPVFGLVPAVILVLPQLFIGFIIAKITSISLPRKGITLDTLGLIHEVTLMFSFAFTCLLAMLPYFEIYLPEWMTVFEVVSLLG